jgi:hypothetical protein
VEQEEHVEKGLPIDMGSGEDPIFVSVSAYADDLILYSTIQDGIDDMLRALADFCHYTYMTVNVKKCVSLSQTWQDG